MSVDLISRKKTSNHLLSVRQSIKPLSTRSLSYITAILMSGAATLALGEAQALSIDFTDDYFFNQTGHYGSALVRDTTTPANNYDSNPYDLLTYTSPSLKMTRGPDGLLRFGAHNLLLHSEAFDNAVWVKSNNTITTNVVSGPNGSATADELVETAATGQHYVYQTITTIIGVQYAVSVYAKSSTSSWIVVAFEDSGGTTGRYVNLSSGTLHTTLGSPDSSAIEDAGGGWYKITIVQTAVATTSYITVYTVAGDGASLNYAGDTGNKRYLFGAHVRRTPSDDTYLPTTTAARYALPYEWDANGDPLGLLVEEQRTNLALTSQNWEDGSWSIVGSGDGFIITNVKNQVTAPDGTTTGNALIENAGGGAAKQCNQGFTFLAQAYTSSVFVRPISRTWFRLMVFDGTSFHSCYFNVASGTVGTASAGVTGRIDEYSDGTNVWYRCSISMTCAAGSGFAYHQGALVDSGVDDYTGESGKGYYIWGAQLEAGSFATSYIPTIASTVTRAADNISLATSAFPHDAAAGTLFVRFKETPVASGTYTLASLSDGSLNESATIRLNSAIDASFFIVDGGSFEANLSLGSVTPADDNKCAAAFALNDVAAVVNGSSPSTDASATIPTVTSIRIGANWTSGEPSNGYIRQLMYLPRRVSNADLQTLTLTGQLP